LEAKGKSFYVFAPNSQDKLSWFNYITEAKKSFAEKKQTFNKGKDQAPVPENTSKAPIWVPDDRVSNCACCNQPFGFLTARKHHCRNCGEVVCGPCSRNKRIVPAVSPYPERVCTKCAKKT